MQITFLGATKTVTGSKYLIECNHLKILVDCGLFQGYKELRLRNWAPMAIKPREIDAVILSHAHIDHSGYLPLLVKQGFTGPIYCTKATLDLCAILLPDSGYIQEEDAYHANLHHYSKHNPALPLYTKKDAEVALKQFQGKKWDEFHLLGDNLHFQFQPAGHILGAAIVTLRENNTTITFSGDLGRLHDPIMSPPSVITTTDYLILESTYGDRLHDTSDPIATLANIIQDTANRAGSIIIPAFAVGRAQSILYYLYQLKQKNLIPTLPIYLDSPMAINATDLLCKYHLEHRLSEKECRLISDIATYIKTMEESNNLDTAQTPKIIITASGMATGGRVLNHLKTYLPDEKNTILFTGFQAGGTRGDRLVRNEQAVKIQGDMVPVRAQIIALSNLSAHADYQEILTWLSHFTHPPKKVFLTHGEENATLVLKTKIETQLGWSCIIPDYLQKVRFS